MNRRAYTTDLTDEQWALLEPLMPPILKWCRPRTHSYREILNAIFYKLRNGCAWQNLPHDLPPWPTVHDYYRKLRRVGEGDAGLDGGSGEEAEGSGGISGPAASVGRGAHLRLVREVSTAQQGLRATAPKQ